MSNIIVMNKPYEDLNAVATVMNYCAGNTSEWKKCHCWGGMGVFTYSIETAAADMLYVKQYYEKSGGRQLCHFVLNLYTNTQSINPGYLRRQYTEMLNKATYLAPKTSEFIYGQGFQNCFFIHTDSDIVHIHFIINSVSYLSGNKIRNVGSLAFAMKEFLLDTCFFNCKDGIYFRKENEIKPY